MKEAFFYLKMILFNTNFYHCSNATLDTTAPMSIGWYYGAVLLFIA